MSGEQETVTPEQTIEQTMAAVYDKANPDERVTRNDAGEFESKEKPAEAAPETTDEAPAETENIQEPSEAESEPEETPAIDPPASWTSEAKEKWNLLSPELQNYVAERESQAQSRLSELGRAVRANEDVKSQLEQLEGRAKQLGMERGQALEKLLAADALLERDPANAIKWLAQNYRVDLASLVQTPQIGDSDPYLERIAQLERQLNETSHQLTNRLTARDTAEAQAREEAMTQTVVKFAEGKDYWPEIEDEVHAQILALKANPETAGLDPQTMLTRAEERAIKLVPAVAEKLGKSAKLEAEKKAKEEAKRKADEAKRLASMNAKSSNGASPKATPKDMYSEMADIYDRVTAT